ncbi:helix-turn-helix domain-containing protein [Kitasatospora sp. NPDC088346]|uniref:helix-turn-helix domain-containing protein n=1 Tax=Kitasatospora sp. NPDC088346 TaxID=3364073 RepID=UPI00381272A7
MGRSKDSVAESAPHYELAQWLRSLRRTAGLTYRQMAELIGRHGCSAVTLSRADGGTQLPRRTVVEAYAAACGASRREARLRWERAAVRTGGGRDRPRPPTPGPAPRGRRLEFVYEPAHLLEAMHRLRLTAGRPSLRELQDRARSRGLGPLPRSTLADVLAGVRMPSEALLVSYVRACGQPDHAVGAWRAAWLRAIGRSAADGPGAARSHPAGVAAGDAAAGAGGAAAATALR